MLRQFLLCALATSAACSFGDDRPLGMTGGDAGPDGGGMDGPPAEMGHLLITEIKSNDNPTEFIEIWNPTDRFLSLGNYYLSDFIDYWKFPNPTMRMPVQADFIVGFPNMMMAPNQVIVVASQAAGFETAYSKTADFALDLTADVGATKAFTRYRLAQSSAGNLPTLTDSGETVVLFYWDGESDLVKDVDFLFFAPIAGATDGNKPLTKRETDGPDSDTTATPYAADSGILAGTATRITDNALSYKRIALEGNSETQSGRGNGINGDDETSEDLTVTWESGGSAPTPGTVAASLLQ